MAQNYHRGGSSFYQNHGFDSRKRPYSSDDIDGPLRKTPVSNFGSRPGFEPVHFVGVGRGANGKENSEGRRSEHVQEWDFDHSNYSYTGQVYEPAFDREPPNSSDSWGLHRDNDRGFSESTTGLGYRRCSTTSNFWERTQQQYTAKYETHSSSSFDSSYSQPELYNGFRGGNRSGLGYSQQDRPSTSRSFIRGHDGPGRNNPRIPNPDVSTPYPVSPTTLDEKQRLISNVACAIRAALQESPYKSIKDEQNFNFILSRSIQACKTNPEYIYVNLKEIPLADLPKNKKVPSDGYACELRCQQVYLSTGYSGSKNGARDRASEQAVRLFLEPVEVRVVERKHRHILISDMVVCQTHSLTPAFVPALCNPGNRPIPKGQIEPDRQKHWSEFVVLNNAHDAICILNNSAAFNRMKLDYKFDMLPNSTWICNVFLQDELLGTGTGSKKISKHIAAEEALNRLRRNEEIRRHQQQEQQQQSRFYRGINQSDYRPQVSKTHLDLVILENSDNAICIINDTAQFNKVTVDYKFSVLPDQSWKCEVYLEGRMVAAGVGPKKTVKHIAANEALKTLKQTHAVVKSNLRKESNGNGISRSQIMGRSDEESAKQEIKADNIGNQLLRKMGWKGGGLGRDGEGIAEPIRVKEQFSREGLGMDTDIQLNKRDIEGIIHNFAVSDRQDDLRFSSELTNDERKQIHQISQKYGLRSKSYGQGRQRFLVVSRKVHKEQLIDQLLEEGQVGRYELIKPQASQ